MFSGEIKSREEQRRAASKMKAKLGFYWHLIIFGVFNLLCLLAYLANSLVLGDWMYPWIVWPVAGSIAGLSMHFLAIFVLNEEYQLKLIGAELQKNGALDYVEQSQRYLAAYRLAEKKMTARLGFYWHAIGSITLGSMCVITYLATSLGLGRLYYPWFVWVLLVLTGALFCHYTWILLFRSRLSLNKEQGY